MNNSLGLIPISLLTLTPNQPVPVDIYSLAKGGEKPCLYLAAGEILEQDSIPFSSDESDLRLYIETGSRDIYQQYLQKLVDDQDYLRTLSDQNRSAMVSEVVRDVLANSFKTDSTTTIVGTANLLGQHIASMISETQLSMAGLSKILYHDYGTFTHSANVAFYASLLALRTGYNEYSLEDIAVGGLLHDLGKLSIDDRVLNKPSRLDDMEFRIIKHHPLHGYRRLVKEDNVSTCQLLMAYQHHEKLDGTGYPVGLVANEISHIAKLCAVVDVYEALTSRRPYRNAMRPEQAIEIMEKDAGRHLDVELLNAWKDFVNSNEGVLS